MKAENFIELIEQNRFDKISRNGMILIAERFRELEAKQLTIPVVVKSFYCQRPTDYKARLKCKTQCGLCATFEGERQ